MDAAVEHVSAKICRLAFSHIRTIVDNHDSTSTFAFISTSHEVICGKGCRYLETDNLSLW